MPSADEAFLHTHQNPLELFVLFHQKKINKGYQSDILCILHRLLPKLQLNLGGDGPDV